jgi:CHASE3 domain sensor protein
MVLVLEAFVILFGTIVAAKFVQVGHLNHSQTQVWTMCAVLMVLLIVASRMQKSPLGIYFGAVLQIPFLMTGRYMDMMYLVAVVFIAIWVASLWLGTKIDRERAAYDTAHPETAPNA